MRTILAAVLFLAACATAAQEEIGQAQQPDAGYAADARSAASDDEVTAARRAYRAACQADQAAGYCECLTGSMAQTLAPADLRIATARLGGGAETNSRVSAAEAQARGACASYAPN